jgi:hypothetical protein
MYISNGRTVADEFSDFKGKVSNSPLIGAATGFFVVSASGSCPVWSVPATKYTRALTFDWLCNGTFATLFERAGWIMLAVAVFCAFRIAVY